MLSSWTFGSNLQSSLALSPHLGELVCNTVNIRIANTRWNAINENVDIARNHWGFRGLFCWGSLNCFNLVTCFEKPLFYRLLGVKFQGIFEVQKWVYFKEILIILIWFRGVFSVRLSGWGLNPIFNLVIFTSFKRLWKISQFEHLF